MKIVQLLQDRSPALRYFVSVGMSLLAVGLTYLFWPIVNTAPFMFAFAAVAVSAWYGGLVPGFFSALISTATLDFILIEPTYRVFGQTSDVLVFIIFTLVALLISTLSDQSIRARTALEEKATELKASLAERTTLANQISQERIEFERIINTLPGIVYEGAGSFDLNNQTMSFISDYAENMLGYNSTFWKNHNFWQTMIHPDDWEEAVYKTRLTYETGWSEPVLFRAITSEGDTRYLESYHQVISDENDDEIRTCGVVMDVTERKKSEIALAKFAVQLNRSNQELEQFAYVASHDLQEPLRMVISYLQLLERRYKDQLDSDAMEFIDFAVDGANRMKTLIMDLLAYSRIHRNQDEFQPVRLGEVLERVKANLSLIAEETKAVITADDLPEVLGNPTQLESLLQNLVENAIKYRGEKAPIIHIGSKNNGKEWVISVSDNGIGIEEKYLKRIFSIFQRLHTRDEYPGTGIGLAVCSKVAEKHGGKIWVESTPDEGSIFYFTLPKNRTAQNKQV